MNPYEFEGKNGNAEQDWRMYKTTFKNWWTRNQNIFLCTQRNLTSVHLLENENEVEHLKNFYNNLEEQINKVGKELYTTILDKLT